MNSDEQHLGHKVTAWSSYQTDYDLLSLPNQKAGQFLENTLAIMGDMTKDFVGSRDLTAGASIWLE